MCSQQLKDYYAVYMAFYQLGVACSIAVFVLSAIACGLLIKLQREQTIHHKIHDIEINAKQTEITD